MKCVHCVAGLLSLIVLALTHVPSRAAETLPLLYADDFEHGMERWQTSDPNPAELSWQIVDLKGADGKPTKALRVTGKSVFQPPYRSPPNFALLKDLTLGDFEITADVQSTNVDAGPHRVAVPHRRARTPAGRWTQTRRAGGHTRGARTVAVA